MGLSTSHGRGSGSHALTPEDRRRPKSRDAGDGARILTPPRIHNQLTIRSTPANASVWPSTEASQGPCWCGVVLSSRAWPGTKERWHAAGGRPTWGISPTRVAGATSMGSWRQRPAQGAPEMLREDRRGEAAIGGGARTRPTSPMAPHSGGQMPLPCGSRVPGRPNWALVSHRARPLLVWRIFVLPSSHEPPPPDQGSGTSAGWGRAAGL